MLNISMSCLSAKKESSIITSLWTAHISIHTLANVAIRADRKRHMASPWDLEKTLHRINYTLKHIHEQLTNHEPAVCCTIMLHIWCRTNSWSHCQKKITSLPHHTRATSKIMNTLVQSQQSCLCQINHNIIICSYWTSEVIIRAVDRSQPTMQITIKAKKYSRDL